jgi:hypothetical protein
MTIAQFGVTFAIGICMTLLIFLVVYSWVQLAVNNNIHISIRIAGAITVFLALSYLIGIILVNALGGYTGLAELLR